VRIPVTLKDGTPVGMLLAADVMEDAAVGQILTFHAMQDISIDGHVVIAKGATATAKVIEEARRRVIGRSNMTMMFDSTASPRGCARFLPCAPARREKLALWET
jgi:hypothetical protein